MERSASEFIIGPRFARTRWRVSNHEATTGAAMRVLPLDATQIYC
jgi:ADP-ribosylglycohydrolase